MRAKFLLRENSERERDDKRSTRTMITMGVVLFMMISLMGISSFPYAGVQNHSNGLPVAVFGAYAATGNNGTPAPSPMVITPPPGGGGGGSPPSTINYNIYVFGGYGEVEIAGNDYSNGQSVSLSPSTTYSVQAVSINIAYKFFQWETNSGSIDNYEASSTSLNTGYSSGSLALVLNSTATTDAWAGFVQSGSTNSVTSVTGEFYVPQASYVSGPHPDHIGIWVGIDGFSNQILWQAGISVNVSSNGAETVTPWYETYPNPPVYDNSIHFSTGNLVQVWTNYSNGESTFKIIDYSTRQSWGKTVSFSLQDDSYAEWIVEDPSGYFTMPDYGTITWLDVSSNLGNLISPLTAVFQSFTEYNVNGQASYPGHLTDPIDFYVTYVSDQ